MSINLNSELLPRRVSSHFYSIKKCKLEVLLNWINLEKKKKRNIDLNLEFFLKKIKINLAPKLYISLPFQKRIEKHTMRIILADSYKTLKNEVFRLLKLKSIGKITNLKKFITQKNLVFMKNKKILSGTPILIDKKIQQSKKEVLKNIFKKKKHFISWLNLKNKLSIEIIKGLTIVFPPNLSDSRFPIKFSKNICSKHLYNNLLNLVGGVFETLSLGNDLISKISLKTELLPNISIYFKE